MLRQKWIHISPKEIIRQRKNEISMAKKFTRNEKHNNRTIKLVIIRIKNKPGKMLQGNRINGRENSSIINKKVNQKATQKVLKSIDIPALLWYNQNIKKGRKREQ